MPLLADSALGLWNTGWVLREIKITLHKETDLTIRSLPIILFIKVVRNLSQLRIDGEQAVPASPERGFSMGFKVRAMG